jgi:hypothetical protein
MAVKKARRLVALYALWLSHDSDGHRPRPLTPAYPAGDERADEQWEEQLLPSRMAAEALRARLGTDDMWRASRLLADGGDAGKMARTHAAEALQRAGHYGLWHYGPRIGDTVSITREGVKVVQ